MGKRFLLFCIMTGVCVADYILLRKSKDDIKQDILKKAAMDKQEEDRFSATLNKMTRKELLDVYKVFSFGIRESTSKAVADKLDPAFKQRIIAISRKYNIFT